VCGVLALLFILIPALEIYVIIQVGSLFGAGPTFGLVVLSGLVGAALAKYQGLGAVRALQRALMQGEQVGRSLAEAALVLVAAVVMLTPGFLTDLAGLLLLVPPVRRPVAAALVRYASRRVVGATVIHDVGAFHVDGPPRPRPEGSEDREPPPRVIDI
jgi:UPF0716 protein FxsA